MQAGQPVIISTLKFTPGPARPAVAGSGFRPSASQNAVGVAPTYGLSGYTPSNYVLTCNN
eukprot:6658969-Prymnesium_polylepis.2